ncbi:MAG TPA: type IV pilus assembly protein PilM [Patescibacteria group bacterium]|nr:type IV pilus assembly protein PilM [Patescibacteria group bacterium]
MKSNSFGLDIGTSSIKLAWLGRENNLFEYVSAFFAPSPPIGLQSESVLDHQEIAQFIKKYVTQAKITTNSVNISLPEGQVFTKVLDMPALSEKEIANAIYWEAEQYIPAQLDAMTLDWSILRRPFEATSSQKMQVLLVAAPLQLVKRYQTIIELAGLSVASIETEIISVVRSLISSKNAPTSLVMHIGSLSTSLAIIQGGIMVFNYSIPLGGIAMTRAIATDFGLSPTQAEEYKKVYGLSDKNFGGKVGKAIQPILTEIVAEVRKAIAFYVSRYKSESPLSQILLTGGGAGLPGIDLFLVQTIGLETVIANPWKILNIQRVPDALQPYGAEYASAIGLALKEYE